MKTSQLFSLVIAVAFLSSTAFAGNPKTETKDTSIDSSEELYVNPLEEVLAMQAIPEIIMDFEMTKTQWIYVNAEEEYTNPLNEVLEMETIPEVYTHSKPKFTEIELSEDMDVNPLQEALDMEAIPSINTGLETTLLTNN